MTCFMASAPFPLSHTLMKQTQAGFAVCRSASEAIFVAGVQLDWVSDLSCLVNTSFHLKYCTDAVRPKLCCVSHMIEYMVAPSHGKFDDSELR